MSQGDYLLKLLEGINRANVSAPDITLDDEGCPTLHWHGARRKMVTMCLDSNGTVHWAALVFDTSEHGSFKVTDSIDQKIIDWINRVTA